MECERGACLNVRMLGEFSMEYQGRPVLKEKRPDVKPLQLLQILLYAGPDGILREQLFFRLYGGECTKDLPNNLRVTIYQLRKLLRESELPREDYIRICKGRYAFVSSFPTELDVRTLHSLWKAAKAAQGAEELELKKKACALYRGHFLPHLSGEEWVAVEEAQNQKQYARCMEELCQSLKEQGEYEAVLKWSSQAASLYPYEEWQIWQMDALTALGRTREAVSLYEQTTKRYFRELALGPSERMLDCFRRMSGTIRMEDGELRTIRHRLWAEEGDPKAYCCSYPGFVDGCRTAVRLAEGFREEAYLLLCTVLDERKRHPSVSGGAPGAAQLLEEALREALDQRGIYTRYNQNQFLAVLPYVRRDMCEQQIGRIDAAFRRREKSRKVRVTYRMLPAADRA